MFWLNVHDKLRISRPSAWKQYDRPEFHPIYLSQSWSQATAGLWLVVHDAKTEVRGSWGKSRFSFFLPVGLSDVGAEVSLSFWSQFCLSTVPTTAQPAIPAATPHARLPFRAQDMVERRSKPEESLQIPQIESKKNSNVLDDFLSTFGATGSFPCVSFGNDETCHNEQVSAMQIENKMQIERINQE